MVAPHWRAASTGDRETEADLPVAWKPRSGCNPES